LQNNKELQKSGADVVTFVMVNSKLAEPPEKKAPKGEEDIVVEHAVSLDDDDASPKHEREDDKEEEGEEEKSESESESSSDEESDESDD
jgi:hypothetical protein